MSTTALKLSDKEAREIYPRADQQLKRIMEASFSPGFFNQKITDRVKTYEDACTALGLNYRLEIDRMKNLSSDEAAYIQIKTIIQALNEGWKPNWDDSSEYKYYPWFYMQDSQFVYLDYDCLSHSLAGSRLCLRTAELAKYVATQFQSEYKAFFLI
jgi:hypothetical protein